MHTSWRCSASVLRKNSTLKRADNLMTHRKENLVSLEALTSSPANIPAELSGRLQAMNQQCIAFCVRKASRVMTAYFDEVLSDIGLKSTQLSILVTLANIGPVGMAALAEKLNLEQSTLSRNLKPLDKGGFISTRQSVQGRGKEAFLTQLGLRIVEKAIPRWEDAQNKALQALADCISMQDFQYIMQQLETLRTQRETA